MRTPSILEQALPFAVLVGSIVTFMRLSRSSEVVAMRASGISTWRFISPVGSWHVWWGLYGFGFGPNCQPTERQLRKSTTTAFGCRIGPSRPRQWTNQLAARSGHQCPSHDKLS
ncbi:MAG: LptF/LptG family permease [Hyphomonadaceae bacterium]|nr:LptF/LptG family permease [Hyphomonadaceae bacterium]